MRVRRIESPQNPAVREALRMKERRGRRGHEAFLIEGANLLDAALSVGRNGRTAIRRVFYTKEFSEGHRPLLRSIQKAGAEGLEVSAAVMARLSETESPQGVVAVASYRPYELSELFLNGVTVVLDGIQDPGNVGTIIRTADAAGASAVFILPGTCDPFMPKALRASAGSVFNLPVVLAERKLLIEVLRGGGVKIISTSQRAESSVFEADLTANLAFVFGNERGGVSREMLAASDFNVRVPIAGRAESLNVTASAAVCLYEALRQRTTKS